MSLLSDQEIDYLRSHRLGRLATTGPAARPHVVPVGYRLEDDVLKIGGHDLEGRGQNRLYLRHLRANPRAAIVVDDVDTSQGWRPSGILIKGEARLHDSGGERLGPGFGPAWLEIVPDYASSWGIDTSPHEPARPRKA
jgi:pyridoxamine 5'-phosphate oxidase family protein